MKIPKSITKRLNGLLADLNVAISYGDVKKIEYLQRQINIIDDKVKNRKEANK